MMTWDREYQKRLQILSIPIKKGEKIEYNSPKVDNTDEHFIRRMSGKIDRKIGLQKVY